MPISGTEPDTSLSLLQRARENDQIAWSRIWELYCPLVYAQCRISGIQPADVDDIAQNVLISVERRLGDFRKTQETHSFRGWLYTITKHEVVNFIRAQVKHPGGEGGSDNLRRIEQVPDGPFVDSSEPQYRFDPVLKRALEMLRAEFDERIWGIFWRFKIDHVPAKQVAEEFGTTDGNVRLIAFRVKNRMERYFDGLVEFPE